MAVYSFLDISGSIAGPGGFANIGSGGAIAEEGITIEGIEDKNILTMGADGNGQHSLVASDAVSVTVRVLKTSPVNSILQAMYELQSSSSVLWGNNIITFTDNARGDLTLITQAAFKKRVSLTYAKEPGMNEWLFDAIKATTVLGIG